MAKAATSTSPAVKPGEGRAQAAKPARQRP
jgi:hypothetical protein